MMRRLVLMLALLAASSALRAQEHDNVSLGFSANRVYQFGELDNVNMFNGNLVIRLPIGLSYPVDEQTSLQLALTYNSKVWDYKYELDGAYGDGIDHERAYPNFRSNAGLGWRLSLGRLLPPSNSSMTPSNDPQNPHGWQYESPTGDEHDFWSDLHGGTALDEHTSAPSTGYTHDSTYLRLRLVANDTACVDFPDGSTHTFRALNSSWRLTAITGPLGGTVTIDYSFYSNSVTQWTISDSTGARTSYVHFRSSTMNTSDDYGQIVDSVDLAAPPDPATGAPRRAVYQFNYAQTAVPRGCGWAFHIDAVHTESPTIPLPMLSSIALPDGSSWSFGYSDGSGGSNCDQGALSLLTLPTGGSHAYAYTRWAYPSALPCGEDSTVDLSPGVTTRTVNGSVWKYIHSYSAATVIDNAFCPNPQPEGGPPVPDNQPHHWIRTAALSPDGTRTDHYFNGWNMAGSDPFGGNREEYALPFIRARWNTAGSAELSSDDGSSPGRFLSTEVFTGCGDIDASGNCTSFPFLTRTTFLRYEYEHPPASPFLAIQARVESERTRYDDDCSSVCRFADVNRSDFDGLGHYRTEATGGNFDGDNLFSSFTNYNPLGIPAIWNLGTYTEKSSTAGMTTLRTLTTFDQGTGFLQQRRVLAGSTPGPTDLISDFTRTVSGNIATIEERDSGGDTGASYRTDFRYTGGVLTTATDVDTSTNSPFPFSKIDRSTDPATGLVTTARDPAGLATQYKYDSSGRIVQLVPPGLGVSSFTYVNANGSNRARVDVDATSSTDGSEHVRSGYEFDGLGRLVRETRDMPGGSTATRDTTYDAMSRMQTQSGWEQGTPVHLTTFGYDAFGRGVSVVPPDGTGHLIRMQYLGARSMTRIVGNSSSRPLGGIATGSDSSGNPLEEPAVTSETYDRLGRVISVAEPSGPPNTSVITSYGYEPGGHLSQVTNGTQSRTFTYDHRGLLLFESHPETSVVYENYDARGHATRTTSGPLALSYTFDAAGRLAAATDRNSGQPLTAFTYAASNDCSLSPCDYSRGKLVSAVRHNYDDYGVDQPVTEGYVYRGLGGRVSRRDTTVRLLSGADQKFRLQQSWDGAGRLASVTYPARCFDPACNGSTSPRTVTYHYGAGLITSMDGYASSVSYQPNGLLSTLVHGNGVSDTWSPDASGMTRPSDINITGNNLQTVQLGPYAYDADGNLTRTGASQYRYDKVSRLVSASGPGTSSTWAYDPYGNMIAYGGRTVSGNVVGAYSVPVPVDPSTNRLHDLNAAPADDVATYDGAGNMTQASYPAANSGHFDYRYTWDALGAMRTLRAGDRTLLDTGADGLVKQRYLYTADGERIGVLDTAPGGLPRGRWSLRGLDNALLSTFTEQSGTWSWNEDQIWRGNALLANESPTGTLHYHLDHLGSPRVVTTATGSLAGRQDFTPFGAGGATGAGTLQFTAHERDRLQTATGSYLDSLDYMHARYYSAGWGRFLSVDPALDVKAAMASPQTWNRYSYVRNNPLRFTDPTGKYVCSGSDPNNCNVVDESVRRMHVAEHNMAKNDPQRAQLHTVLTALGNKGDSKSTISHIYANAVDANGQRVIPKGDAIHGFILGAPGREKGSLYLSLENALASPRANGNSDTAITLVAGTITHEAEHRLQPISGESGTPSFLSHVFYEHEAYTLENAFFRAFGQPSLQQDATNGALGSATKACGQSGCEP